MCDHPMGSGLWGHRDLQSQCGDHATMQLDTLSWLILPIPLVSLLALLKIPDDVLLFPFVCFRSTDVLSY